MHLKLSGCQLSHQSRCFGSDLLPIPILVISIPDVDEQTYDKQDNYRPYYGALAAGPWAHHPKFILVRILNHLTSGAV